MTLRVYVAGPSSLYVECRAFIERMETLEGVVCAYDWTQEVHRARERGVADADLSDRDAAKQATQCLGGVEGTDVLVLLTAANTSSIGMWVELGYALGAAGRKGGMRRAEVIVVGPRVSIFQAMADYQVESQLEALGILQGMVP